MSKQSTRSSQVLAPRHDLLFKQLVRFYETKQYKKGIRTADQILKAQGDHGETLAMKGLIMNCMGNEQQSQALVLIKKGLMANLQSHVCWHVLGLYHRAVREYAQAIKAYLQALRLDVDNIQILRDLSLLQVQIRDLPGYEETRRRLLVIQPAQRHNWLAYSVAACLGGRRQRALDILKAYQETLDRDRSYEYSEMILFQLQIMIDEGLHQEALHLCQEARPYVVDLISLDHHRADLLLKLGQADQAKIIYRQLLDTNPDHAEYHKGWQSCSASNEADLLDAYRDLSQSYPAANMPKLLPLEFVTDPVLFESLAEAYISDGLSRSVPCLFRCVRRLYSSDMKRIHLTGIIERYAADESVGRAALQLHAEHLDFIHSYDEALKTVDRILELHADENDHSCIDVLIMKARILKHMGAYSSAHETMDQARQLDLQDRFLNTKTVRYALRAGLLPEADRVVSLFLRDGDTIISLFDMQCMWYELGLGEAHAKQRSYGPALHKFSQVDAHFNDIADDQFDFHMYCLRRQTLSAYVSMLRWEDTLRGHRFAARAARNSIQIYLNLHRRSLRSTTNGTDEKTEKMHSDSRQGKKAQAKARRAQNKTGAAANKPTIGASDAQLDGHNLVNTKEPLKQALVHMRHLLVYAPSSIETYIQATELYFNLGLPLRVLHSLIQASSLPDSSDHFGYQRALLQFALRQKQCISSDPIVNEVIALELPSLIPSPFNSALEFAQSLISKYASSSSYEDCVHAADLLTLTESGDAVPLLMTLDKGLRPALAAIMKAKALIDEHFANVSAEFRSKARQLYPLADDISR